MHFQNACNVFKSLLVEDYHAATECVLMTASRGLTEDQVVLLTESIAGSGKRLVIKETLGPFVDVPSTGGPASLTTLLCPLLIANRGFRVPKLSATGSVAGGIDAMGIIPGFDTHLAGQDFIDALTQANIAHAEPSEEFCAADKFLIEGRRQFKMMENRGLAAASLLAKKFAIPGVMACFDFRVGASGNIGSDVASAREAAVLFHRVAHRLGIRIRIALTDNRVFPSSAMGRLESLFFLHSVLAGESLELKLDQAHVSACVKLAASACEMAKPNLSVEDYERTITRAVSEKGVLETLKTHLIAQGASVASLGQAFAARNEQSVLTIRSEEVGFWFPPPLVNVKDWFKAWQRENDAANRKANHGLCSQVGLRLLATPGERVGKSQPLVELRYHPSGVPPIDYGSLRGTVSQRTTSPHPQILEWVNYED